MAVVAKALFSQLNATPPIWKGMLPYLELVYSSGRKRKNDVIMIVLHSACKTGSSESEAMLEVPEKLKIDRLH